MHLISQYKGLPKQVYMICAARIIAGMGAFIFSFSTLLMTGVLGMSDIAAGYMTIVNSVASLIGAVICGRLADMFSRKKVLLGIFALQIAVLILGGFVVYTKASLFCIVMVGFCFSGFIPILAAMITDVTDDSNRKESFSLLFLCINIGYSLGQIIAGQLFYNHTRWIFWGQGLAFIIAFTLVFFFVKDINPEKVKPAEKEVTPRGEISDFFKSVLKDKVLIIFLCAAILAQYCYSQLHYLMPLQLTDLFGLEISSKNVSYVWTINGFCCVALTPLLLSFTKRFSQITNVAIASAFFLIGMGSYAFLRGESTMWIVLAGTPIWTAGEVLLSTGTGVFIADRAKPEHRATYQSLYALATDIGRCAGPVTMGYLLQAIAYADGWFAVCFCAAVAIIILMFGLRCYHKEQAAKLQ